MLKVVDQVGDLFRKAVEYRKYYLIKKSASYIDDVVHEFYHMAEKMAGNIRDRTLYKKAPCR